MSYIWCWVLLLLHWSCSALSQPAELCHCFTASPFSLLHSYSSSIDLHIGCNCGGWCHCRRYLRADKTGWLHVDRQSHLHPPWHGSRTVPAGGSVVTTSLSISRRFYDWAAIWALLHHRHHSLVPDQSHAHFSTQSYKLHGLFLLPKLCIQAYHLYV